MSLRAESSVPPPAAAAPSPNDALAALARESILKSLPPEYEKRENWGHQKPSVVGFEWNFRDGEWHLDKRTKPLNDGLWRMYRLRLVDPEKNLSLRFTPPEPAENNRTAMTIFLTARMHAEAWQEQWRIGIKGLNFYLEAETTIEVRLDVEVGIKPAAGGGFGSIEVDPHVNNVGLRLVDLKVERIDKIGGDIAKELGKALKDVVADELHKREPEIAGKINKEIDKHRDKLRFSPSQIANLGWDKIQTLLGGTPTSTSKVVETKKPQ
jgi:hypothetical protein